MLSSHFMSDGLEDRSGEMAAKGFQLFAQFCSECFDAEDFWEGRIRYIPINDFGLLVNESIVRSIDQIRSNQINKSMKST
jgi:hypothetical protein